MGAQLLYYMNMPVRKNKGGRGRAESKRNKMIVQLIESKEYSHQDICDQFGFKSKGTVSGIYRRERKRAQLSTA